MGHDIIKSNSYDKMLINGLRSTVETIQYLLINLFKGYMACSDKKYVVYKRCKENAYKEGTKIQPDRSN